MTNADICELYDLNPDMTLTDLSHMTGKTIAELKRILMAEAV